MNLQLETMPLLLVINCKVNILSIHNFLLDTSLLELPRSVYSRTAWNGIDTNQTNEKSDNSDRNQTRFVCLVSKEDRQTQKTLSIGTTLIMEQPFKVALTVRSRVCEVWKKVRLAWAKNVTFIYTYENHTRKVESAAKARVANNENTTKVFIVKVAILSFLFLVRRFM